MSIRNSVAIGDIATTLSEKAWEQTQIKAFTKWVNLYLGKRNMEVFNLQTDFADGVKLINLLEQISDTKLGKYQATPKLPIHQIANLNVAHKFLINFYKEVNIKVVPSPEQINEGDLRAILGMVWVLILRFSIADIDEGGLAAKEGLLLWCQRNTAGYAGVDPPGIQNFHTSWKNGLGFGALINKFRPDLLDYSALNQDDPKACMQAAFEVAEKQLGIPPLLDPEDIADVAKPDEKSLMTYLAEYWKVFSADTKIYLSTKRLNRAINRRIFNCNMRDEYLAQAKDFIQRVDKEVAVLEAKNFGDSFDTLRNQYFDFEEFQVTTKPGLASLKLRVEAAFQALQSKLSSEKFPAYEPPEGLSVTDINSKWDRLSGLVGPYEEELTGNLTALFKTTFEHFDKDNSNTLTRDELQACFSALSLELSESENKMLYGDEDEIAFEKFVKFMMDKLVDSSDSQQIREACKIVSRDRAYIAADALKSNIGSREFEWVMNAGCTMDADEGPAVDCDRLTEALFAPL